MNELVKIFVKFITEDPSHLFKTAYKALGIILLLLLSACLYRVIISDFSVVKSIDGLLNFFLSGYFLKSLGIFVLSFFIFEILLGVLITKVLGLIFVDKAIEIKHVMKSEKDTMPEDKKKALVRFFNRTVNKGIRRTLTVMSEDADAEDEKFDVLQSLKESKHSGIDVFLLTLFQLYIFAMFIGHHHLWIDIVLVVLVIICAFLKGFLIFAKTAVEFFETPNPS